MCLDGAMGVAIAKKLTTKQLSKQLVDCKQKELLEIITELYSACPDACDYLNIRFGDEGYKSAMLADATKKVREASIQEEAGQNLRCRRQKMLSSGLVESAVISTLSLILNLHLSSMLPTLR